MGTIEIDLVINFNNDYQDFSFTLPVQLLDECDYAVIEDWDSVYETFTFLQYFENNSVDLDSLMYRADNASIAMANETYCGPHSYYFVYTDDQSEGDDFDNVVVIEDEILTVGPGIEKFWYQFEIAFEMDWRTEITSEMSESYTTFYVEVVDACPITGIKPFTTDDRSIQYTEWTSENMTEVTSVYDDDTEDYQIYWDDYQELASFEAQCQNNEDEEYSFTVYHDTDYISDAYEQTYFLPDLCGYFRYTLYLNGSSRS